MEVEEIALKKYPEHWIRDIEKGCDIDENRVKRDCFIQGYEQALKDKIKEK